MITSMRLIPIYLWASLFVSLMLPASVWTQTTRPAAAPVVGWPETMAKLGDTLARQDQIGLQAILDPLPVMRAFGSDTVQTPERLISETRGAKVIGAHAYVQTPLTLATDLVDDFRNAGDMIPESTRQEMIPPDAAAAKRANETAAQWLVQVLQPDKTQPVGIVILWPEEKRSRPEQASSRRPIFVLAKAQLVDGVYVFRQITFGDPLEPSR